MQKPIHIETKELPQTLQDALNAAGYRRKDIALRACESACLTDAGSEGRRGFVVFVNLVTGQSKATRGSWGGANIFNPRNAVDLDTNEVPIPEGVAVIQGSEGYGPTFASVLLNPANVAALLPARAEVTDHERAILGIYRGIKGGYRQGELERINATLSEVDSLVDRGLLKRNRGRGNPDYYRRKERSRLSPYGDAGGPPLPADPQALTPEEEINMGEYVTYAGQGLKLGTCEDLMYIRHEELKKLVSQTTGRQGNLNPREYLDPSCRWFYRFPVPTEDQACLNSIGARDPEPRRWFMNGAELAVEHGHTTISVSSGHSYNVNMARTLPAYLARGGTPSYGAHQSRVRPRIYPVRERIMPNGELYTVFECGWCRERFSADAEELAKLTIPEELEGRIKPNTMFG